MEIWLRLLALNLHYCGPELSKVQSEWIDASHDLECSIISLDGLEAYFPEILKATERLIERIEKCEDEIDGSFLNLLGFTDFFAPEGVKIKTQSILRAGYAFRALHVGDESKTMKRERGEQNAPSKTDSPLPGL